MSIWTAITSGSKLTSVRHGVVLWSSRITFGLLRGCCEKTVHWSLPRPLEVHLPGELGLASASSTNLTRALTHVCTHWGLSWLGSRPSWRSSCRNHCESELNPRACFPRPAERPRFSLSAPPARKPGCTGLRPGDATRSCDPARLGLASPKYAPRELNPAP